MGLSFYEIADLEDGFGATKGRKRPHRGLDIPRPGGTPIPAWRAGTVVISEYHSGLGWVVETDSGGIFPGYCHMIRQGLPVGTRVEVGDTIGYVGTTGSESGGNHLHTTAGDRRGAVFGESMSYLQDPWPLIQAAHSQPAQAEEEDEDMARNSGIYWDAKSAGHNTIIYAVFNTDSGFWHEFSNGTGAGSMPGDYNNSLAGAMFTPSWAKVTEGHARVIRDSCAAVRQGK